MPEPTRSIHPRWIEAADRLTHDSLAYVLDHGGVEADWCVIDGPPEIQLGNKGRVDVLVTVKGKQAHSSRPWEGVDAIDGAMKVLEKLKPLMPYPEAKAHPELGKVSLTPNAIESFPKATHTIQNECRIMFDRRLLPGDDPNKAVQQIKDEIGAIEPFEVVVEPRDFMMIDSSNCWVRYLSAGATSSRKRLRCLF